MRGAPSNLISRLAEDLARAGLSTVLGVDRHIIFQAGLPLRSYNTKPIYSENSTNLTAWQKEDWAPTWAVVLCRFHRRVRTVETLANGISVVPEVGYKEMTELLRSYKDSEDATYAALAAAALCEDKEVAKLAQDAIKLPLYGVQGTPGL